MPRNQMYNGHSSGTGYRGTSAPIAPYAFSSTPQLRQENRSVSAPQAPVLQAARLGHPSHPSSSSDSTVSTSGSSNRSLANPAQAGRDGDARKQAESLTAGISLNTTALDLSFSVGDTPVKPSPGRYRRGAGRTDSSTSIPTTGASTPTQRLPTSTTQPTSSPQITSDDLPGPTRPGHSRAISADDSSIGKSGGVDAAKRYRRRSFNGLDANALAANMASMQVAPVAPQSTTVSAEPIRPASSSGRQNSRPASSHSHDRQGSAGSASSKASSRSQVSIFILVQCKVANFLQVSHRAPCSSHLCFGCWWLCPKRSRSCKTACTIPSITSRVSFGTTKSGKAPSHAQRCCPAIDSRE